MAKLNSAMALNNAATIVVDSAEHKPSVTNDALYRLFEPKMLILNVPGLCLVQAAA
jgi:hypothetical protein